MYLWQIWFFTGITILIIDLFASTMFLVNIAFAFFLTALCAYFGLHLYIQLGVLAIASSLFLIFLRPFLLKMFKTNSENKLDNEYIHKTAKVISPVSKNGGRITIYGEEWSAKTVCEKTFEIGQSVKIVNLIDMTMIVDEI